MKALWARITSTNWRHLAERAAKTFAQAFVASFAAWLAYGATIPGLRAAVVAAIGAGLSALTSLVTAV